MNGNPLRYFSSDKSLAMFFSNKYLKQMQKTKTTISLFLFINYQNESSLSDHLHDGDALDNYENMENTLAAIKTQKQVRLHI